MEPAFEELAAKLAGSHVKVAKYQVGAGRGFVRQRVEVRRCRVPSGVGGGSHVKVAKYQVGTGREEGRAAKCTTCLVRNRGVTVRGTGRRGATCGRPSARWGQGGALGAHGLCIAGDTAGLQPRHTVAQSRMCGPGRAGECEKAGEGGGGGTA